MLSVTEGGASSSSLTDLLSLSRSGYISKVQNKALNFNPTTQLYTDEAKAVRGRKRNRGDPESRDGARRSAMDKEEGRRKLAIPNRGKRKKAVLDAGAELTWVDCPFRIIGQCEIVLKCCRYDRLKPLHHLHTMYLTNLLNLPSSAAQAPTSASSSAIPGLSDEMLQSKLSKADFTGALLTVASARNPSLSGLSGIVIEETASTFRLLTPESVVKVIPKNGTLFHLSFPAVAPPSSPGHSEEHEDGAYLSTVMPIPPDVMEHYLSTTPRVVVPLLGTNFGFRSGDRAGRKFRPTQGGGGGSGWGEEWVKGEWSDVLDLLKDEISSPGAEQQRGGGKSGKPIKRRRGKARRKDPPAFGALEIS